MVAIIKTGYSIKRILNYNENKVIEKVAECIGAGNYPIDHDLLNINMKLNRFQKQLDLNEKCKRNSVHVSLNFHESEGNFSKEKLMEIADSYMKKIGFKDQPYLIYRHDDAGHPHIHIVSIKVRSDGTRIDMNNIGRNQSEAARKAIEKDFNLVRADDHSKAEKSGLKPVSISKANYGKKQTRAAIQNVLEHVLDSYKFTSLAEFNALLKQYNVTASRGSENSRVYKTMGLQYHMLDAAGKTVGVPIKASSFCNKPTLGKLDVKFKESKLKRVPYGSRIKTQVDLVLKNNKLTLDEFKNALSRQGIHVEFRKSESGLVYGVTYIDYQTKCVFNGSSLGKQYSAKAVQARCTGATKSILESTPRTSERPGVKAPELGTRKGPLSDQPFSKTANSDVGGFLDKLMQPEQDFSSNANQFKKRKRKKRRKNSPNN